jgi:transcriptional regulator with XRE-family HTH domain
MYPASDLRMTRIRKGLRIEDLASPMLRPATISEIENGLRVPRRRTREKIESIVGPVDWLKTFSTGKEHLTYVLYEFLNPSEPGLEERVRMAKQTMTAIETFNDKDIKMSILTNKPKKIEPLVPSRFRQQGTKTEEKGSSKDKVEPYVPPQWKQKKND